MVAGLYASSLRECDLWTAAMGVRVMDKSVSSLDS